MFTRKFWRAASERAIKTAAQTVLSVYFVGDVIFDFFSADWQALGSVALGGAFFSVLTSITSDRIGDDGPSLTSAETLS